MRAATALVLALAACGGRVASSCEKVVARSNECDAARGKGMRITSEMADTMCKDERHADYNAKLAACANAPDCAAFDACIIQNTPGLRR